MLYTQTAIIQPMGNGEYRNRGMRGRGLLACYSIHCYIFSTRFAHLDEFKRLLIPSPRDLPETNGDLRILQLYLIKEAKSLRSSRCSHFQKKSGNIQ